MPISSVDDPSADSSLRLSELIRREADAAGGCLPFDRFMELALYAPGLGYYVAGAEKLGAAGDFATAPEISPLFGRCIAAQCAEVLDALGGGDVLEFGAGSGALAAEVLLALERHGQLPARYRILELSPDLKARQRALLARRVPHLLARVDWPATLPTGLRGIVLANEVVDAMPVHRFRISDDGAVQEVYVVPTADGLAERVDVPRSAGLAAGVCALQARGLAVAPGYASEINLRLAPWVAALSSALARGLALIIDYGYPRAELYHPRRGMGTLMCHVRHRSHADPYAHIGLQDITAHVDFSALADAGAEAGFSLAGYTSQAGFLLGCGLDTLMAEAMAVADPVAAMALAAGVKQLVLPSRMGERFGVIGLTRGDLPACRGFSLRDLSHRL